MEQWDVYDSTGKRTGKTKTRADVWERGEYHLGVSLWLVNENAQVLIQKRSATKRICPNMWCNVCGSAIAGETSAEACLREAREEVGIVINESSLTQIGRIIKQNNIHDDYAAYTDLPIERFSFPVDEVSALRWASLDEIGDLFRQKQFLLDDLSELDSLRKYTVEYVKP